jgi:hypothetical protein
MHYRLTLRWFPTGKAAVLDDGACLVETVVNALLMLCNEEDPDTELSASSCKTSDFNSKGEWIESRQRHQLS